MRSEATRYLPAIASGLCAVAMLIVGAMVMQTFGCWGGCRASEISDLSYLLLPGLAYLGASVAAYRWLKRDGAPSKWMSVIYLGLGLFAAVATVWMISLGGRDPVEMLGPVFAGAVAALQFTLSRQIWRIG